MCGPAALPLVAAGMAAASAGVGALAANAQARFKAKIAERNADMEREAGQQELENTRQAALDHYRKVGQLKGAQRARAAAAGVGVDFGTAAGVVDDTEMLAREDVGRIYKQGAQNLRGHDIAASNYEGEASASRQAGTAALIKGGLDMGSSLLSGAKQYKDLKGPAGSGAKNMGTAYSFGNG
ncbi:virion core protein, T7 gp14 family [Novosphingobium pentaromativorans]|uniref:virion core protein, T7 gp14 family n=1 Tax=Novosphingobium pentaromativorans TaxID=205844 RepID=UPI00051F7253|nr:hypothetical protein [Novosphingobium pentaromativorans]AIT81216.1 hypothetical protein JI59_16225 [Novosphingobium pentaromativorans US6-1]